MRFLTTTGLVTQLLEARDTRTLQRLHKQLEAAQFLFCKLIEHQTEGGFWFSMLR